MLPSDQIQKAASTVSSASRAPGMRCWAKDSFSRVTAARMIAHVASSSGEVAAMGDRMTLAGDERLRYRRQEIADGSRPSLPGTRSP